MMVVITHKTPDDFARTKESCHDGTQGIYKASNLKSLGVTPKYVPWCLSCITHWIEEDLMTTHTKPHYSIAQLKRRNWQLAVPIC